MKTHFKWKYTQKECYQEILYILTTYSFFSYLKLYQEYLSPLHTQSVYYSICYIKHLSNKILRNSNDQEQRASEILTDLKGIIPG